MKLPHVVKRISLAFNIFVASEVTLGILGGLGGLLGSAMWQNYPSDGYYGRNYYHGPYAGPTEAGNICLMGNLALGVPFSACLSVIVDQAFEHNRPRHFSKLAKAAPLILTTAGFLTGAGAPLGNLFIENPTMNATAAFQVGASGGELAAFITLIIGLAIAGGHQVYRNYQNRQNIATMRRELSTWRVQYHAQTAALPTPSPEATTLTNPSPETHVRTDSEREHRSRKRKESHSRKHRHGH